MKNDTYEVTLRRIMCIFLSLEALFVCWLSIEFTDDSMLLLRYHETRLADAVITPAAVSLIFIIPVLLSCFFIGVYVFYEGMHLLAGLFLVIVSLPSGEMSFTFVCLLIAAALSARLFIYNSLMRRYNMRKSAAENMQEQSVVLDENHTDE